MRDKRKDADRQLTLDPRSAGAGPAGRHHIRSQKTGAHATGASAIGAEAVGTLLLGALAIGALAIGAVAISRLAVGRARIRKLEIDELVVRRLRITERLQTPDTPAVESTHSTSLVKSDDTPPRRKRTPRT
jgi:hypothetical protein